MITDTLARIELTAEEERDLIRIAREKVSVLGHSVPSAASFDAKEKLLAAYAPIINRSAKVNGVDWDDMEADLIEAFMRAIDEYDFQSNNRLSYEIKLRFTATIRRAQASREAFHIPSSTRALFYNILYKEADGNWNRALRIAEQHPNMSRTNFVAIAEALHAVESIGDDSVTQGNLWGQPTPYTNSEVTEFVNWLRDLLSERERMVIDLHYGFDSEPATELRLRHGYSYDEVLSIPQIASAMNLHRQTIWRAHNAGIGRMRSEINVDAG